MEKGEGCAQTTCGVKKKPAGEGTAEVGLAITQRGRKERKERLFGEIRRGVHDVGQVNERRELPKRRKRKVGQGKEVGNWKKVRNKGTKMPLQAI